MSYTAGIILLVVELLIAIVSLYLGLKEKKSVLVVFVGSLVSLGVTYLMTPVPTPEIWPTNGVLSTSGEVKLKAEKYLSIYYTLDENLDPKNDGTKYNEPLKIKENTTIVAKTRFLFRWSKLVYVDLIVNSNGTVSRAAKASELFNRIEANYTAITIASGESISKNDLEVIGIKSDGGQERLTDYSFAPKTVSEGDNEIRISYGDLSTTIHIKAGKAVIRALSAKLIFDPIYQNTVLSHDMFEVYAIYTDKTKELITDYSLVPTTAEKVGNMSVTIDKENVSTTVSINVQKKPTPELSAISSKEAASYTAYPKDNNEGFTMFGAKYAEGFSITVGAALNIWDSGNQYTTFTLSDLSTQYSKLSMLMGNVDGVGNTDLIVKIYLDKTVEDAPDYEYTVSPQLAPQIISIPIYGKSSMTIQVLNTGQGTSKLGFTNISFS